MEDILGIVAVYIGLAGVGIVDVTLFRQLTTDYLNLLRRDERSVLARGLAAVLFVLVIVALLTIVGRNSPPDNPAQQGAFLLAALALLLVGLAFALGYGALAWHVGERVLQVFKTTEPLPGWSILVGSLLIIAVVWVPILGWALGLYWLMLAVGVVIQRLFGGAVPKPTPQQGNLEEPS